MLMNTGTVPVFSKHGLVTTVAFKFGSEKPVFALEVFSRNSTRCFAILLNNEHIKITHHGTPLRAL